MEKMTKQELEVMLKNTNKEILNIDYNTIYSFFYFFNKNMDKKREELVELSKKIQLEIMYREDDEKRLKYEAIRKADPLKNSRRKIMSIEDIMQK